MLINTITYDDDDDDDDDVDRKFSAILKHRHSSKELFLIKFSHVFNTTTHNYKI